MHRSNMMKTGVKVFALVAVVGLAMIPLFSQASKSTTAPKIPAFKYDGAWPKLPLPNAWTFEGITGLTVDKDDVVWVLERPGDFDEDPITHRKEITENFAALNPPTAT